MKQTEPSAPCVPKCPNPTPPMLINEISRLFRAKMSLYEPAGATRQDSVRQIMRQLAFHDGCSQLELVNRTHLKAPTVSVALRRMEEEGLVERKTDEIDLRVVRVYLSEKGRAHNQLIRERLHAVDDALMQGFSQEETEVLLQFLERMRDNILPDCCKNHTQA